MIGPTALSDRAADAPGSSGDEAQELTARLLDCRIPSVPLRSFMGDGAKPEIVRTKPCAIYFYPGSTSPTEVPPWSREDAAQHRGFHQHRDDLAAYGATAIGISSEPVNFQLGAYSDLGVRHPLFSDPTFELAQDLDLPTFSLGEHRYYRRLTLVTRQGGYVEKVFYPVEAAARSAAQVCVWLRMHRGSA